ncbi:MAG: hypothetical protein ABEJ68_08040 [Halobacteriaceae archaeon]
MADTLAVHLGRDEPQSVSVADAFETTGTFELAIHNHGAPAHVHLHVDDALASVVDLRARNHYVESETVRTIEVAVDDSFGTVTGTLEVMTSYGAESDSVDITVTEAPTVAVDETLSEPNREPPERSSFDAESAPVAIAAVVAVGLFVAAVSAVGEGVGVAIGVTAVVVGIAVAAYLLVVS